MVKKAQWFWIGLGLALIIFGLVIGWEPIIQTVHAPNSTKAAAASLVPTTAPQLISNGTRSLIEGHPLRIVLPSLGLDLPVINGYYNAASKTWTLTKDKAQYAVNTVLPNNQQGNTFIYGHNRSEVFENLYKIQAGQHAVVYTDNGHVFTYTYAGSVVTSPNDDSLFAYQGAPMLTLQTCSGLWYQNRQLFHFNLVSVS